MPKRRLIPIRKGMEIRYRWIETGPHGSPAGPSTGPHRVTKWSSCETAKKAKGINVVKKPDWQFLQMQGYGKRWHTTFDKPIYLKHSSPCLK